MAPEAVESFASPTRRPRPNTHPHSLRRKWKLMAIALTPFQLAAQDMVELPVADRALTVALEEVYRLGGVADEGGGALGLVEEVAFDQAGRLFAFDKDIPGIIVVGPDGDLLHESGREGEGPGEFISPEGFTVLRDGSAVVYDGPRAAFLVFGPEGGFERRVRLQKPDADASIRVTGIEPAWDGTAVVPTVGITSVSIDAATGEARFERGPVERINLKESQAARQPIAGHRLMGSFSTDENLIMFAPGLLVAPLPAGGAAFVDSATYAVNVASPLGGIVRILTRAIPPRQVTEDLKEAWREITIEQMTTEWAGGLAGIEGPMPEQVKQRLAEFVQRWRFAGEVPVVRSMKADWDGLLWVERTGEEITPEGLAGDRLTSCRPRAITSARIRPVPFRCRRRLAPPGCWRSWRRTRWERSRLSSSALPEVARDSGSRAPACATGSSSSPVPRSGHRPRPPRPAAARRRS